MKGLLIGWRAGSEGVWSTSLCTPDVRWGEGSRGLSGGEGFE
jgi:hypothetical protein